MINPKVALNPRKEGPTTQQHKETKVKSESHR